MWVPNLRGGPLCFVVEANHQPASADQHTYCLTPIGGGLPLFTEMPRRDILGNIPTPFSCSVVHEYSGHVTNGSKFK
jgi:hypothetical protein